MLPWCRRSRGPTTFEDFFHAEKDRLIRVMRVITGSRAEAEDITQEAFLRVFERWETVAKMDNPEGYLHRVAMNQFRSRYRRAAVGLRRAVAVGPSRDVFAEVDDRDLALRKLGSLSLASARRWCSPRRSAIRAKRRGGCWASRRRRSGPSRIRRVQPSQRWRKPMDDPRSLIERGLARAGSESYTLESFYRRRDRKRARTRFTAGVVGLAIAIVLAIVGSAILRSAPEDKDVGGKGPQILRTGEVLQVEDPFSPAATLVATDPATGHQRSRMVAAAVVDGSKSSTSRPIELDRMGGAATTDVARPTGDWGVGGGDGSTIHVTSLAHPPDVHGGWIWAWSPVADQLAFATGRPGLAELVLFDPATSERTTVTTVEGSPRCRGRRMAAIAIAVPSSSVSVIDLQPGVPPRSAGRNHRGQWLVVVAGWDARNGIPRASSSSGQMDRAAASSSITASGVASGLQTARGSLTSGRRVRWLDPVRVWVIGPTVRIRHDSSTASAVSATLVGPHLVA